MKRLLILMLAALLMLSATAIAEEPLRVAWWGSETSNGIYLGQVDIFVENTGIACEPEYLSWDDYWTKLNTLAAAGDLPDVVRMDYAYILSYAEKGLLMDLTPLVEAGQINLEGVPESAISGGYMSGGLYGINAGSNAMTMATNAKLVADAGMAMPTNDMTWEEFEAWVVEFHEKTGLYGADLEGFTSTILRIYARSLGDGKDFYNAEQTEMGMSLEELTDYFTSIKRMHDAGAVQNVAETTVDVGKENYFFSKAEAATMFTTTDSYTTFDSLLSPAYGGLEMTIIPGAAENKGMFIKPSQFLSISAGCENIEDAAAFVDAWTMDVASNLFIAGRRGVPISPAMAEEVASTLDESAQRAFAFTTLAAEYASPLYPPEPTANGEIDKEYENQLARVLFEADTPENAAQALLTFAKEALAE